MSRSTGSRTYLVECFVGPADVAAVARAHDRLRSACADLRSAASEIEYLGALLVPQDELLLHVFASTKADVVREVCQRAELRVERIVEAVTIGQPPDGTLAIPTRRGGVTASERLTRRG